MDHCLGISLTLPGIFQEVKEAKEVKHEGKEGENATKQEAHQEKAVHAAEHDAYAEVVQKGMVSFAPVSGLSILSASSHRESSGSEGRTSRGQPKT